MKMENTTTQSDNEVKREDHGFISLEKRLKLLLVSMKIAAVYFDPTPAKDSPYGQSEREPPRVRSWLTCRVYSYTILLILWFNSVRNIVGLFPADDGLPMQIIATTWYLQSAVNSTIMLVSCQRLKHLRSFYKHWDSLFDNVTTHEIGCHFICPLKYLKMVIVAGWVFFVVSNVAFDIFLFVDTNVSRYVTVNSVRPFPVQMWLVIIETIIHGIATGVWIFPFIFVSAIARIIQVQFLQFRKCLSRQTDEANGCIPHRLSQIRCHFTQLCQAVENINGTFKWILGMSFIFQTSLACFISYLIITRPPQIFVIAIHFFWFIVCVLCILVLAISSSNVHNAAHSALDDILRIGTKDATCEQLGQLYLLGTKLTGTSIGFTAIDFFVITKEFILTLTGLYVTYFFLLLQFKLT